MANRNIHFTREVSLTISRQATATESLNNQRQKCRDTVVAQWAAWKFFATDF